MSVWTETEGFGNLVPAPHYAYSVAVDHIEILFSTVGLNQKGCTIPRGLGIIYAGTALARRTSTKKFEPYSDVGSDGLNVCRGFLRDTVDTSASTFHDWQGNIVLKGSLRNSKLIGVDAAAIADLNARVDTVLDVFEF